VYTILKILDKSQVLTFTEKYHKSSRLQFLLSPESVRAFVNKNPVYADIIDFLIRNYTGIHSDKCTIDLGRIAEVLRLSPSVLSDKLEKLSIQGVVDFQYDNFDCQVQYITPREDDFTINKIAKEVKSFIKYRDKKLSKVVRFVEDDTSCKSQQLLAYFGEESERCGVCSVCRSTSKKVPKETLESRVLNLLRATPLYSREIEMSLLCEQGELITTLHRLMKTKKIALQSNNRYKIRD